MSNRFVVSFQFSVVRGWTVGHILSESRMTQVTRILRVFRSLTKYLERGILFALFF